MSCQSRDDCGEARNFGDLYAYMSKLFMHYRALRYSIAAPKSPPLVNECSLQVMMNEH
jgi:hypothetical protein